MKRIAVLVLVLFAALNWSYAAAQDVRYDFDKDKNFTQYRTYKLVSVPGTDELDSLTTKQITAAIDAELAKKGMEKTNSDNANLLIAYQTAIGSEKQYTSYSTGNAGWGYGPGWGYGGWYGGYGGMTSSTTHASTSTIYIGQLDLSMYDSSQKQLAWRGSVSKTLDPKAKPEKKENNINKAIAKLLKNYPPKVKK